METFRCVTDEKGRLMRRNIVRYALLSYVITLQKVSLRVKKRFPSWQHMVDSVRKYQKAIINTSKRLALEEDQRGKSTTEPSCLFTYRNGTVRGVVRCQNYESDILNTPEKKGSASGIMMDSEKKIFDLMDVENKVMSKYWLPLVWATNIITRARKESLISSDHLVQTILTELSDIRRRLGSLIGYDTVCLPLVYTQIEPIIRKKIAKIEGDNDCDRTEPDAHTLRAPPRSLSSAPSRFGPMFSVLSGVPV
ncbi:hypothetical protein RUM43_003309 [Polyplax serrata]|uniref:Bestrophin homolog n=1 Tax=Polyplax serrata TaxID=468196 RepID=A0AAN8PF90_POLSC